MRPRPASLRCRRARLFTPRYRRAAPGQRRPNARASWSPQTPQPVVPAMFARVDLARCTAKGAPQSSRGFIIVAVLWIVAALATLASIYALYVRETAAAFAGHHDRLEAQALALAGVELAVYQITAIPDRRPSQGHLRFRMGTAEVIVDYRSESARIDLNLAPKELLAGL